MKSLLLRRGASSAVVVAVCCSLLLGNAFGQEEDGHVFGDSNIDGQFLGSSDKSMVNGMDSPECSMSDSGDVSFGGELSGAIIMLHYVFCCSADPLQPKR